MESEGKQIGRSPVRATAATSDQLFIQIAASSTPNCASNYLCRLVVFHDWKARSTPGEFAPCKMSRLYREHSTHTFQVFPFRLFQAVLKLTFPSIFTVFR